MVVTEELIDMCSIVARKRTPCGAVGFRLSGGLPNQLSNQLSKLSERSPMCPYYVLYPESGSYNVDVYKDGCISVYFGNHV